MATDILMPQMGESIAEGTITRWLVKVGDQVERDQPLLEISTDKVDAEIPSPAGGVLLEIRFKEGETVPVNKVIGHIGAAGALAEAAAPVAAPAEAAAAPAPAEAAEGSGEQMGVDVELEDEAPAPEEEVDVANLTLEERIRRFSSPLVRSIAEKEGIDLRQVSVTGIHGLVT
jgi:pyruvate dehydrogenase E2 component (dihydrolipoamide acetyltransferase)